MNNQKNFVLAIVLSLGFMVAWQYLVMPRFMPKPVQATTPSTTQESQNPSAPSATVSQLSTAPSGKSVQKPTSMADVTVRFGSHEVVVSPLGGAIRHWHIQSKGQPLDLVHFPELADLPLATFPENIFSIQQNAGIIRMSTTLSGGVQFIKTIELQAPDYLHRISFQFKNPSAKPVSLNWNWGWGPGLNTVATELKENESLTRGISFHKHKTQTLKDGASMALDTWAALDNRYYLVAFLPEQVPTQTQMKVLGAKSQTHVLLNETMELPARGELSRSYQLYVGPKGYTHLRRYEKGLEASIDFGWFTSIGKGMLRVLYYFQKLTGNYGWAIVCLTILLQIVLLPLSLKSFRSMQAMKKMQPQIAELQAKYKEDPKRLNLEMMNLYKKSGANPLGGCLPMLLQMPIFVALFNTLRNAYELRGEPFVGWIHDLSVKDPYYVLPIVMGASMFLQQRLSGPVSDPTQKQMMYLMPIIFTAMFFNFPAGLVLYWLVNNIFTILFQYGFLKLHSEKTTPSLQVIK